MTERVVESDMNVAWDYLDAQLFLDTDFGPTILTVDPAHDDPDRRIVVLVWTIAHYALSGSPNDEALEGHRLYSRGLSDILRIGIVEGSELIAMLERQNSVHPHHDPARFALLTHYVLPLKERVIEVVAENLKIERWPGTQFEAMQAAFDAKR